MASPPVPRSALPTLESFAADAPMFCSAAHQIDVSKLTTLTMENTTLRPSSANSDDDYDHEPPPPSPPPPLEHGEVLHKLDSLAELASPPQFCSLRRSITDYSPSSSERSRQQLKGAFPNSSTSALDRPLAPPPPTYDEYLADLVLPRWRGKIMPREEEGREQLPAYSCTIQKEGLFALKVEMDNPFEPCLNRTWKARYLVIQGTKLEIREPKAGSFFVKGDGWKPFALAKKVHYGPGRVIDSFTLQLAEVGMAADYRKRNFVIRLRIQTQQLLIACPTVEVQLAWLEAFSTAIGLAAPLEERSFPNYRTVPRRRRHGRRRSPSDAADASAGHPSDDPEPEHHGSSDNNVNIDEATQRFFAILDGTPGTADPNNPARRSAETRARADARAERRRLRSQPDEHAIDPETGKWLPRHVSNPEAHITYAKRCVPTLLADAPRQNQYVICHDMKLRIWWERRVLVGGDVMVEFQDGKIKELRRSHVVPQRTMERVKKAEEMRALEENVARVLL